MQKVSSYLYLNRIEVIIDSEVLPVRWRIVYQNKIKIYQGVDNTLTIDVKNSDQKRINITEMNLRMIITDTSGLLISDVPVTPSNINGLANVTIPESDLVELSSPQFLEFSIYRINTDETKTVLYADSQFGAKGSMELVGNVMNVNTSPRYISRFLAQTDPAVLGLPPYQTRIFSDAVEITLPNFVNSPDNDQINFEFKFSNLDAEVVVEFTKDPVISTGTEWITIETFNVESTTSTITKSYNNTNGYNREMRWARTYYTPELENTGKIDKIIITL
jgi:hypothetical protein